MDKLKGELEGEGGTTAETTCRVKDDPETEGGDFIDVGKYLDTALSSDAATQGLDEDEGSPSKSDNPKTLINKRKMGPRIKIEQTDESKNPGGVPGTDETETGERSSRKRLSRKKLPKYCEVEEDDGEEKSKQPKVKGKKGVKRKSRPVSEENIGEVSSVPEGKRKGAGRKGNKKSDKQPQIKKTKNPHPGERPFVCDVCSMTFDYVTKLKQHAMIHTDHRPFECNACESKFRSKADLSRHLRIHTRETPYACSYCPKKFVQRAHLIRHTRTHTMEAPFECNFCGRRFNDNSHLTIHKRLHTGSRPYQCDECEKSFISSSNLQIHKRSHTLERSYVCALCTRSFSTSGSLVRHIRTHTQEKPYECEFCAKRFCDGSNLRVHRFIHTRGRRPSEGGDNVDASTNTSVEKNSTRVEAPASNVANETAASKVVTVLKDTSATTAEKIVPKEDETTNNSNSNFPLKYPFVKCPPPTDTN